MGMSREHEKIMTDTNTIREIQRLMDASRDPARIPHADECKIAGLLGIDGEKDEGGSRKDEKAGGQESPTI
jgi:hypothetical protein